MGTDCQEASVVEGGSGGRAAASWRSERPSAYGSRRPKARVRTRRGSAAKAAGAKVGLRQEKIETTAMAMRVATKTGVLKSKRRIGSRWRESNRARMPG